MKKLVILAAVALMAVVSQAAIGVTWQTGTGVKMADGATSFATTTAGYVATIVFSTTADMKTPMAVTGTTSANAYKSKGSAGFGGVTGSDFDKGTYYAQVTITETATGKYWESQVGSFTVADGETASKTINFTSGLNMGGSSLIGSTQYKGGTPEPTPEPTSAVLLLLGVAGLALKRKQA